MVSHNDPIFLSFALTECPLVQKCQPYSYIHFILNCPPPPGGHKMLVTNLNKTVVGLLYSVAPSFESSSVWALGKCLPPLLHPSHQVRCLCLYFQKNTYRGLIDNRLLWRHILRIMLSQSNYSHACKERCDLQCWCCRSYIPRIIA